MYKVTSPDPWTTNVHIGDGKVIGDGTISVQAEDESVTLTVTDEDTKINIDVYEPDALRSLGARLIEEASLLQDRHDVRDGVGGDQ